MGGARVIRSQVLALRETEYVMAARAMGASTWRIIFQHLLPNVSNIIIVSLSASLGAIAGTEIALTWFGVGVQPPTPSFGAMLFEGGSIRTLQANPHLLLVPGARCRGAHLLLQPPRRRPDRRPDAARPLTECSGTLLPSLGVPYRPSALPGPML